MVCAPPDEDSLGWVLTTPLPGDPPLLPFVGRFRAAVVPVVNKSRPCSSLSRDGVRCLRLRCEMVGTKSGHVGRGGTLEPSPHPFSSVKWFVPLAPLSALLLGCAWPSYPTCRVPQSTLWCTCGSQRVLGRWFVVVTVAGRFSRLGYLALRDWACLLAPSPTCVCLT